MSKVDVHKSICLRMNEIYAKKNSDYGDSFAKTREVVPGAILVRLHDKLSRLDSLLMDPSNQKVKDESINDTLLDLANYCVMELVERDLEDDMK